MTESKATKERATENNKEETKASETDGLDVIAELSCEAERVIAEASEAASREAKQELDRILDEYERKTKQIVLKIREDTKAKTADIASRLSDTIMRSIEQASSKAVNNVAAEFNIRAGELSRKMEVEAASEIAPAIPATTVTENNNGDDVKADVQPQAQADESKAEEPIAEDNVSTEVKAEGNGHKSEAVTDEEGIELKQPLVVDDFDQWLTQ